MKTPPTKKVLFMLLLFIATGLSTVSAQPDFGDDVDDEPAASISDYAGLTLALGAVAGYYLLSKKSRLNKA
ncbi:hypothetical protein [Flavobacterium litorale]|uniref:Uncharacterized protein n=1 Tax=Flavobacterium litorale TaxID=2856519 RepID=A0ABX8V7L4_9FLAO|nr:hypothetical protein [Flavobacterium litorale]QYJ68839.1 hypothetical protein K1I41_02865 [Flavobacterium litorale]